MLGHRVNIGYASDAVRAIRNDHLGYTQAFHRGGRPRTGAGAQGGFFFERHAGNDGLNIGVHVIPSVELFHLEYVL